jgi:hypothetical protein
MDDLAKLLKDKGLNEPPEISKIKQFIKQKYDSDVTVLVRPKDIVLSVDNAALANTIRLNILELKSSCQITKKVSIRIGS